MQNAKQDDEVLSFGVLEKNTLSDPLDLHVEEVLNRSCTIIPDVFTADEVGYARQALDKLYADQTTTFGAENLEKASDVNNVRCPLAYDDHFLNMATNKKIHSILAKLLGANYVLMMQNAVINQPNRLQYQVRWHRDLSYQHWTSSKPLVLNFLIAIDKFTLEGGATFVLPGSHLYEKFPSSAYVKKHEVCLEASAGSVLLLDAMTFHRAGINSIPGFTRRALNHVVGLPFMAQQIDIPNMLAKRGKDLSKDPFLYNYLGYRWNPAHDVEDWRGKHLNLGKRV